MKRTIFISAAAVLLFAAIVGAQVAVKQGTTSLQFDVLLSDANGVGATTINADTVTVYYHRGNGSAAVAVPVVNIGTLGTYQVQHDANGAIGAVSTNMSGLASFQAPNNGQAAGATEVTYSFTRKDPNIFFAPAFVKLQLVDDSNQVYLQQRALASEADFAGLIARISAVEANMAPRIEVVLARAATTEANAIAAIYTRMATFNLPTNFSTLAIDGSGRVTLIPGQLVLIDPNVYLSATRVLTGIPNATAGAAGGLLIAGINAPVTITSATGTALTISSTGGNGYGVSILGHGTGHGLLTVGGTTGDGMYLMGGSTEGRGFHAMGTGNGSGMRACGSGTGEGFWAVGGEAANGNGCTFEGTGANSDGLQLKRGGAGGLDLKLANNAATPYPSVTVVGSVTDQGDSNWTKTYLQPGGVADANDTRFAANAAAAAAGGSDPNVIADAIWRYLIAGITTAGTAAKYLTTAGGAADPLLNLVPGAYGAGTAGLALGTIAGIKTKTDLIATGGAVTIISAIAATGNATITAGTDYKAADARALVWTDVPWTGPALHDGNATLAMKVIPYATWKEGTAASVLSVTVTATSTGAGKVTLTAEMTAAQTAALAPRPPSTSPTHVFQIIATITGGSQIHVLQGMMTVILGIN